MRSRVIIFFSLLLVFVTSVNGKEVKIQVVVTSDVHAQLFSYDFVNGRPLNTSLANVHYMMQSARSRNSNNIILLDNGDLLQGSPAAYYANFVQGNKQNLFSRVLNLMEYDAANIGNHDIEAGPQVYNRLKKELEFPYLGANVLDAKTGEPYFQPYTIIERQQVRVAVLGLTTTGVPNWLPAHLWEGLQFQEMVEAAEYWVSFIQENENPDIIIGLFHSGMGPATFVAGEKEPENASLYIAQNVPGFDIIFTGHDHRERIETIINQNGDEVLIMGPGDHAETIAVAEITMDKISRKEFRKTGFKGELVSASDAVPSRGYMKAFEKDVDEIVEFANEPVGTLLNSLSSIDAFYGSAPFSDLIHEVQLEMTGADISFTAPLTFNEVLPEGILRVRDFFKLYQYENYLYAMELSGKEILDYLEYSSALWFNEMEGPEDHLLLFRRDPNGEMARNSSGSYMLKNIFFNFDSAAGINYTVDVSKPAGQRIHIISMEDGSPFEKDKIYRVAINSYRGSGGGAHLTKGVGLQHENLGDRIVFTSQTDLRTELINYFKTHKQVKVTARNNWQVIPAEWVDMAKQKDMEALFPE